MSTTADLPFWARARLSFDRIIVPAAGEDAFADDIDVLIAEGEFAELFRFVPASTTRSSIEMLFERRSNEAVLLWDRDCLDRIDGLLALVLADDGQPLEQYHRLAVVALCELLAGMFAVTDPAITMEIMTLRAAYDPEEVMVTVNDDERLDRFRRLVRVYLFHHELGHLIYATDPAIAPDVGVMIDDALRHFSLADPSAGPAPRTSASDGLIERGLVIPYEEIGALGETMRTQLAEPGTREETWCDGFAIRRLVDWAVKQGIPVEECYAVDVLLHLFVGARLQWFCYWSPRNPAPVWDEFAILGRHQARAHVRGLIFVVEAYHGWRTTQSETGASAEALFLEFEAIRDGFTDPLIETFYERFELALALLQAYDRTEALTRAEQEWRALSGDEQDQVLSDILHDLSHFTE